MSDAAVRTVALVDGRPNRAERAFLDAWRVAEHRRGWGLAMNALVTVLTNKCVARWGVEKTQRKLRELADSLDDRSVREALSE